MRPETDFIQSFRWGIIILLLMSISACVSAKNVPKYSRIAFHSGRGINLIDPDGMKLINLIKEGGRFIWSSDGQFITFIYNDVIYIVDSNGNKPMQITNIDSGHPTSSLAWSPDSKYIAIGTTGGSGGGGELYLTNIERVADGFAGTKTVLVNDEMSVYNLSWSLNSKYLAFDYVLDVHDSPRIAVIDNSTGKLTNIVYNAWSPAWSPDGKRIAYVSGPYEPGKSEIYSVSDVSNAILNFKPNYHRLTDNNADDSSPIWSPDGKNIAFTSYRDGNWEIYLMNADGSYQKRLTDNPAKDLQPSWSPDGKQIAFVSNRDGNQEIYVMDADGSHLLRLTNNDVDDWTPVWQP